MSIDFYYSAVSPPCRSVLLTAKALDIEMNLKEINILNGEHLTPEFTEINPQHTIPTIDDNGFRLWESRAIMTYLANQYGKDSSLYPRDIKKRAIVDQRLDFDLGILYARFGAYYYPAVFNKEEYDPKKLEKLQQGFDSLNTILAENDFAAGDSLTLADLTLVVTVSTCEAMGFDISPYDNVITWYEKVKETAPSYEEINATGAEGFRALADELMQE